jgi:hypothetical protein
MSSPRPCPYCSNRRPRVTAHDDFAAVECEDCGARGPVFGDEETPLAARKESAVRAWNGPMSVAKHQRVAS